LPLGYLLARSLLLSAHMRLERYMVARAQRQLRTAQRLIEQAPSTANPSHDIAVTRREYLRSLRSQALEVEARIAESTGKRGDAIKKLEASYAVSEGVGTSSYLLARILVGEAETRKVQRSRVLKAERAIEVARRADMRDLYGARIAKLEERLAKLSGAPAAKDTPANGGANGTDDGDKSDPAKGAPAKGGAKKTNKGGKRASRVTERSIVPQHAR
jgi:hypothetical protein